ncbi:import inner membrane translocase subunit tim-21, mitochondrial [Plenodomus tracheiphilus IPT5]|uniref:Mitochondrial import inner membrane translocase subunit Tim21 n=1 Tax=Plenodomus tracheiphilus IPT5 TaxID=1408161 RepID=A0A6A7B4T1_9PLEO|nr:import inner membrane translocase subunit tim-21, mitochondrial [Plenodomus tracheiphilus IPT5]
MTAIYRPTEAISLLRPCFLRPRIHPSARARPQADCARLSTTARNAQATHSAASPSPTPPPPPPPRRSITLTGDTGRVRWSDLSPGEKVVRTTQQSVNLVVVIVGIVATGGVATLLFTDVFSPSSKTAHFNRATSLIRADPRCQKLLGPGSQISAHGEGSWSRWARNRYISSTEETDKWGTNHMRMRFYVEGPLGQGVVNVHLTKRPSQSDYEYAELAVDVKGHQRLDLVAEEKKDKVAPKIFGARWW